MKKLAFLCRTTAIYRHCWHEMYNVGVKAFTSAYSIF